MASISAIFFDFGGVLAEEGFRQGLLAIGKRNGCDAGSFFNTANELIYETGYVMGMASESDYWNRLRACTGISGSDEELRREIISLFVLRPEMMRYVIRLRAESITPVIVSDQTNWLDEIEGRTPFFHLFDRVFNSYHLKKTKRDPSLFTDICDLMDLDPDKVLFVDDNIDNIMRASDRGLKTIHFKWLDDFGKKIGKFGLPDLT